MARTSLSLWVVLGLSSLPGCARWAALNPQLEDRAQVTSLALSFPEAGRGLLALALRARSPSPETVPLLFLEWELYLEARHFASGVRALEGRLDPQVDSELTVRAPLAFRPLPVQPGQTRKAVVLRGWLGVGDPEEPLRLPFVHREKIEIDAAPVLPPLGDEDDGS